MESCHAAGVAALSQFVIRRLATQSGNPSSYKAVIEANKSGRPAVEKLEPFQPGLVVIVAVRGGHLKGALCTPHVPV